MSVLSLEERGHIAQSLAGLTHFGSTPFTSRVQSNPQRSADWAWTTGNKHDVIDGDSGADQGLDWLLPLFLGH